MSQLEQIYRQLGLSNNNGLYFTINSDWQHFFSYRISRLIEEVIQPKALFVFDNKPFIFFFENIGNKRLKRDKLNQIWNFNETPIVIISNKDSVEIYNGLKYYQDEQISTLATDEKLNDFSYFEIVTGNTWDKYASEFNHDKRVDSLLLENIKTAREIILKQGIDKKIINSLLGKIIFTRYLIDRKIKIDFYKEGSRTWTNKEFCELLNKKDNVISFFNYLKERFNGNLFPIEDGSLNKLPQSVFDILSDLLRGKNLKNNQLSLFELYDFSIIPVEFISNVYELFIGQQEQENEGAYYTPLFLVDYILKETVEKKLEINGDSTDCKVLDPSCGSGIFLVETLRKIIEKYQRINPNYKSNIVEYKKQLKQLALDNIFGVDKDESAINVAAFSIYLTLLDYQDPSDIEGFKFPVLINKNFFVADFFDLEKEFNKKLGEHSFDFILGNPPWKRGSGEKNLPYVSYIKERRKAEDGKFEHEIAISNKEIAQAFTLRVSDFSNTNTKIALIVTSKILYNINGVNYRKYFLDRFALQRVFELAPVRKEIFNKSQDKAIAPAAILFYQLAEGNTENNTLEHITLKPSKFFSMFKIFTIQRNDFKYVRQGELKKNDYLWKVLVYGNYLDYNLIKRLKSDYATIKDVISNKEEFIYGQGVQIGGGDKNDASEYVGMDFIDAKKDIKPFWVNPAPEKKWELEVAHRVRNKLLFKAPMLLTTTGVTNSFRSVSAVSNHDIIFKHVLTSIKTFKYENINILYAISGILSSSFFSYLNILTFSSSGIEREQAHDVEKFSIPFIFNDNIESAVIEICKLRTRYHNYDAIMNESVENEIYTRNLNELDKLVIEAFNFSQQEKALLSYSTSITIPLIMKHKGYEKLFSPLKEDDNLFTDYAQTFFDRFDPIFEKGAQKLSVEIKHTNQIVGLFFKVVDAHSKDDKIIIKKSTNDNFIKLLTQLGTEKITEKLFVQKDVRGFETDGFYLVKPNENRLWNKALSYADVDDFMDAILIAAKNDTKHV